MTASKPRPRVCAAWRNSTKSLTLSQGKCGETVGVAGVRGRLERAEVLDQHGVGLGEVPDAREDLQRAVRGERGRVRQLEQMLKNAVVIDTNTAGDVVEPGTLVDLRYAGDDDLVTYLVGSIEERHEKYDVLSTNSPLGQAIIGKGPDATVTYQGPKREMSVTVVAVRLPD